MGALIRGGGGDIRTDVAVTRIEPAAGGGMWVDYDDERAHFDKVVFTSPVSVLERVAAPELLRVDTPGGTDEYLGVVCGVLVTRRPLVPYYIVNIADGRIPFTGVIGMSNLVSPQELGGYHLTYLPKYVLSDDPLLRQTDDELRRVFGEGLRVMFPDLDAAGIQSLHVNRAFKVQPLQVLNYSTLVPRVTTRHEDFFVLNYFPLLLLTKDGKNLTPARLPRRERAIVAATCDPHLRLCLQAIKPPACA